MIFKKEVWITPYQMNRRLHIYVPQRAMEEGRRCPVLYMFDGHNLFEDQEATYGKSWGLKDYLDHSGLPLIVVGMECNHEGNSRLVEYSPYTFTDHQFGTIAGSGRQMMRWVVEELKPLIDRELPTLTSRKDTWIAGSSMGGLMSLYTITAHNDTFPRQPVSPYLFPGKDMERMPPAIDPDDAIFSWEAADPQQTLAQLDLKTNLEMANLNAAGGPFPNLVLADALQALGRDPVFALLPGVMDRSDVALSKGRDSG
ncbi:MAG: alpha/beta hydrolase [Merdibacter sp.]